MIDSCGFIDLGFTSPQHTWTNNREDGALIMEQIDRASGNQPW